MLQKQQTETSLTAEVKKPVTSSGSLLMDPLRTASKDDITKSTVLNNPQLMRRINEMQNFDMEMLHVLQTTPEPSKKYKMAEPPLT